MDTLTTANAATSRQKKFEDRVQQCMKSAESRILQAQRDEWERLAGRETWEFDQCGYLNWEDQDEGATMIETEICEYAIYNVFACQTMTKVGLPVYKPSKCAPRNIKTPCSSQRIREDCLRTTEDAKFTADSDLDCVWCISGNCAVDNDIRCATRKYMNDIGQTVNPTHTQNTVVGHKNDADKTPIVEEVDSAGTYEYCKVIAEDASEHPSSAPTAIGRSVDIDRRQSTSYFMEGYLMIRDSNSGGWGLVCNSGITATMRQLSCAELGYADTYTVDLNKQYVWWRRLRRSLSQYDGTSISYWKDWGVMDMDQYSRDYKGDWYKMNSCTGDESTLNECSYTKTSSCSEGAFVLGCAEFEPKPGCSTPVAKVTYRESGGGYSVHMYGMSNGYDDGNGLIFRYDYQDSKLVYTDYKGNTLKTGTVPIVTEGIDHEDWKDPLKWQQPWGEIYISEFHFQCGGMLSSSILSTFGSSTFAHILALIGIISLTYFAYGRCKTSDFKPVEQEEM